jgi:hypothetical protein
MSTRIQKLARHSTLVLVVALVAAISNQGCTNTENKGNEQQLRFSSADDAVNTLITALRSNDKTKLEQIFGAGSDQLLSSGDDTADQFNRQRVLEAYDQKHQLVTNSDGSMTLDIGEKDWPMPIPIVKDDKTNKWVFDTDAGADEIVNRRIGRNELDVIQVCQAIGDAQREYATQDHNNDGVPEYARKFISDAGQKNGLYWEAAEGEAPSPLGELVADAQGEGYSAAPSQTGQLRPYHGYYYRILTAQGKDAPGGAQDYVVNGKLIGGYAIVAWPAEYGNSGIMTFIVNNDGDVYEKDLGEATERIASRMTSFNPDHTWKKVVDTVVQK